MIHELVCLTLRKRVYGMQVYSFMWGNTIVVVLNGGNKNSQDRDIKKAKKIRDEVLEGIRTIQE